MECIHSEVWGEPEARRGRSPIGTDCVICTRENASQQGITVLQVIEGLSYLPEARTVEILLFFVVQNRGPVPSRLRIVHRGRVEADLHRFSFQRMDPTWGTIRDLYAHRIRQIPSDPSSALFFSRVNCLGIDQTPVRVSLDGPGCALRIPDSQIRLEHEVACHEPDPAYSSFLIPPEGYPPMQADESTIFAVELKLKGKSYDRLVAQRFSVDSYARLMREIETYDLPGASQDLREFYEVHVRPRHLVVDPRAYDIVIFQDVGHPVEVESASIHITPVRPEDEALARKVLWFFGQPDCFYLVMKYTGEAIQGGNHSIEAVVRE